MKIIMATGLTAALLRLRVLRRVDIYDRATLTKRILGHVTFKSLAGDDTVDF